jgi:hypothetical protein
MVFQYKKEWWKRIFEIKFLAFFALFALIILAVFLYFGMKKNEVVSQDTVSENIIETEKKSEEGMQVENIKKTEEKTDVPVEIPVSSEGGVLSSENYKISQVYFGGSVALLDGDFDSTPVEISFNRAETFIAGDKDESKLSITWKTSRPAVSEIEYSMSGGQNPAVIREKEYGLNHNVTIGNLDPGTAYLYRIKVRDRWNNEAKTNYIGIYTDKKKESVFDLIAGAIEDVFGWALPK